MEPLSALSIATGVVQFVDFTSNLISGTHVIYNSAAGESARNHELRSITENLVELNRGLEHSVKAAGTSASDAQFVILCQQCDDLCSQLVGALNKLMVKGGKRGWASFLMALKSVWSKEEIADLQQRMESFKTQISLHLLVNLRYGFDQTTDPIPCIGAAVADLWQGTSSRSWRVQTAERQICGCPT